MLDVQTRRGPSVAAAYPDADAKRLSDQRGLRGTSWNNEAGRFFFQKKTPAKRPAKHDPWNGEG